MNFNWLLFLLSLSMTVILLCVLTFLSMDRPKLACIYAYFEKDALYKENLRFFLKHGLNVPNMTYYIIVNGECTVPIPLKVNVVYRANAGYDFGAWSHALSIFPMHDFDFVFFLNTSVRGPFRERWPDHFLERFKGNTKLVGTSINIHHATSQGPPFQPHVQSMFFCLDREALAFLMGQGFFDPLSTTGKSFQEVIREKEIGMSRRLLDNGWNIDCVLSKYQGRDYRRIDTDINPTSVKGDPYYVGAYFGGTIDPKEAVFFKNARLPAIHTPCGTVDQTGMRIALAFPRYAPWPG